MSNKFSRREFLKAAASAGMVAVAAASNISQLPVLGQGDYQGEIVILSASNAEQHQYLIDGIEANFPGVNVAWRGLTSERYTELFAAAEIAGDQIDIMDLNGQDLRRYAVGGRLKDLSGCRLFGSFPARRPRDLQHRGQALGDSQRRHQRLPLLLQPEGAGRCGL